MKEEAYYILICFFIKEEERIILFIPAPLEDENAGLDDRRWDCLPLPLLHCNLNC